MRLDNPNMLHGGPAFPGINQEVHLPADDHRPFQIVEQAMNGMSVRDVATLQILGAMIQAHRLCTPALIIEAFDMADVFLEVRSQT